MKNMSLFLLMSLMVLGSAQTLWASEKPQPLFDGKTLAGWEGNQKLWRIEDGALVGGNLENRIRHNDFLCTEKSYGDFELTLQVKLKGKGANSGVQVRTQRIPEHHEVIGYQADLGDGYWGALYDESRRNRILAQPEGKLVEKILKRDDWNDYKVRCEGPRIRIWLNGQLTVDYTETDDAIPQSGIIGLQIHSGPPSEAWFRNLEILELN